MSDNWQALEGEELAEQLIKRLSQAEVSSEQGKVDMSSALIAVPEREDNVAGIVGVAPERDGSTAGIVGATSEREGSLAGASGTASEPNGAGDGTIVWTPNEQRRFWSDEALRSPEEQEERERIAAEMRERAFHDPQRRQAILEAVLFAAAYPVQIDELVQVCGWPRATLESDLDRLATVLEERGLRLQRIAGGCRLVTAPDCAYWVENYLQSHNKVRLSRPQMETLAIVAYNQPVTRAIVDTYRGVHSERVLAQLEDLHLIREVGRAPLPGRPILLGTTAEFLRYFALDSLDDLPQLFAEEEAEEIAADEVPVLPRHIPDNAEEDSVLGAPSDGLQRLLDKMRRRREREAKREAGQADTGEVNDGQ